MSSWRTVVSNLDGWSRVGGAEPTLADEAEAYLQGRLLERQRAAGARDQVPSWLSLSGRARPPEDTPGPRRGSPTSGRPAGWRASHAALAGELMDRTGDATAIARTQRELLMPLEIHVDTVGDLTPGQLYDLAVQEMWLIDS